jgi:hypothetical protein
LYKNIKEMNEDERAGFDDLRPAMRDEFWRVTSAGGAHRPFSKEWWKIMDFSGEAEAVVDGDATQRLNPSTHNGTVLFPAADWDSDSNGW